MVGLVIDNQLEFDKHIKSRAQTAMTEYQAMAPLQNTRGGITTAATHKICPDMICAIFTYVSEIWHCHTKVQDYDSRNLAMQRLKYQTLRRITGSYNSSNHIILDSIAMLEPLETKLDDISVTWFTRSMRTTHTNIRDFLYARPTPRHHRCDNGKDLYRRNPNYNLDSCIYAVARLSSVDREQIRYGDHDNNALLPPDLITDIAIMRSTDPTSQHRGPWLATLSSYLEEGWRLCYSDRSGAEGHAASAAYLMSRRDGPLPTKTVYLKEFTTSADVELQGTNLALQISADMNQVLLISDRQASVSATRNIASGTQPLRSGIERERKQLLSQGGFGSSRYRHSMNKIPHWYPR